MHDCRRLDSAVTPELEKQTGTCFRSGPDDTQSWPGAAIKAPHELRLRQGNSLSLYSPQSSGR